MAKYDGDPMDWPRLRWRAFQDSLRWKQGEHLLVIGDTGSGKTTLLRHLVPHHREFVVVFVTKTFDQSFDRKKWPGFTILREWDKRKAVRARKVLLWPEGKGTIPETVENQKRVFDKAINEIFNQRGWCLVIDEMQWMIDQLRFDLHMRTMQHQGRSSGLTIVSGFQRPAGVPLIVYTSASRIFFSNQTEDADVKRISGMAGLGDADPLKVKAALPRIAKHDWLYLGKDIGACLTRIPDNLAKK